MKKVILTIIVLIMLLPFVVKASSCDASSVTIESISVEEKTGTAIEKSNASVENNDINLDLSMNEVGDSITYKIDVRNDSDEDMKIDKDTFNVNDSEYIKYTFNNEESVFVRSKTTSTVFLRIEYHSEVPTNLLESGSYEEKEDITFSVSTRTSIIEEIINPKTGDIRVIIVAIVLVLSAFAYLIFSKEKPLAIVIIITLIVIPTITYALCELEFNIKTNIEIKNIAEFAAGEEVNNRIFEISNGNSVKSFKRSNTLPDTVKSLADSQLAEYANIVVTGEEINEIVEEYSPNPLENFYIIEENDDISYCGDFNNSPNTCYLSGNFSFEFAMPVKEPNSEEIKYLVYKGKSDVTELLTRNEFENYVERYIRNKKGNKLLKNVFSSDKSGYTIYGWYDENNHEINYYCENTEVYLNEDSSDMFTGLFDLESIPGIENVNTSNAVDMSDMFYQTGMDSETFNLNLSSWDTSNVENMNSMFFTAGAGATTCNIGSFSSWNTSKSIDMENMFSSFCQNTEVWSVEGFENWDVSKVKNMSGMFEYVGSNVPSINIDLSSWNTSSVEDISKLFYGTGYRATTVEFNLTGWDTSKVKKMFSVFAQAGQDANSFIVKGLSNWNISNAKDISHLFSSAGEKASTWNIGDISSWNTSNVTNMYGVFRYAAKNVSTFELDLSRWDVSKVTDMAEMFDQSGYNSTTWSIGDISSWNTSNVVTMKNMFLSAGKMATTWNNIGTLNVYADNIYSIFANCNNAKAIVNIYSNPDRMINYEHAFSAASTVTGAGIVVNYSSNTTNIDIFIATKSSNSNVTKGVQLD